MIGSYFQAFLSQTPSLLNKYFAIPALLTAAFGVTLSTVSSYAHLGVYWKNHRMLLIYTFLLTSLVIIELVLGITGLVTDLDILDLINDTLRSAEAKYGGDFLSS